MRVFNGAVVVGDAKEDAGCCWWCCPCSPSRRALMLLFSILLASIFAAAATATVSVIVGMVPVVVVCFLWCVLSLLVMFFLKNETMLSQPRTAVRRRHTQKTLDTDTLAKRTHVCTKEKMKIFQTKIYRTVHSNRRREREMVGGFTSAPKQRNCFSAYHQQTARI
jgi:hypothetical protein